MKFILIILALIPSFIYIVEHINAIKEYDNCIKSKCIDNI